MNLQVSYKKQFALGVIFLLIILASVEGLVRFSEIVFPYCDYIGKDALDNIDIEIQKQECFDLDHFAYTSIEGVLIPKPNQHFPNMNINSFGFRGPEITQEKPADTVRIFLLGGSTTFGTVTSDSTTIPAFLQEKIDISMTDQKVQVINAGVLGFDSTDEIRLLNNYVEKFDPDIIMVYDGINNASVNQILTSEDDEYSSPMWLILTYIYEYYRTPTYIYKNFMPEIELGGSIDEKLSNDQAQLWRDDWKEACSQKRDYKIIIFIQPSLSNKIHLSEDESSILKLDPRNKQINYSLEKIQAISSELNGVCDGVFDLRSSFENVTEAIFYDHAHVNQLGNKIIAEKMYDNLLAYLNTNNSK
jgi:hypothetical protein